jgi:hypothetical protein
LFPAALRSTVQGVAHPKRPGRCGDVVVGEVRQPRAIGLDRGHGVLRRFDHGLLGLQQAEDDRSEAARRRLDGRMRGGR